jgi:hypothetical protein
MRTSLCGIPLSIKGGPNHGREKKMGRADKGKREHRGWGQQVPREEIGSRTAVKLFSREKSVETYKIYIL